LYTTYRFIYSNTFIIYYPQPVIAFGSIIAKNCGGRGKQAQAALATQVISGKKLGVVIFPIFLVSRKAPRHIAEGLKLFLIE